MVGKIIIGAIVLVALIVLVFKGGKGGTQKHETADSILEEAEILLAYEKKADAIKILNEGKHLFPGEDRITKKLNELENN